MIVILLALMLPLAMLTCWAMVTITAWRRDQFLAILCLVGGIVTLGIVPFVIGWMYARPWKIVPTMAAWTALAPFMIGLLWLVARG